MERQKLIDKINNSSGKAKFDALLEYSNYLRQNDAKKSLEVAEEALEMCDSLDNYDNNLGALMHICYAYYYMEDYVKAKEKTEYYLQESENHNAKLASGTAYGLLGRIAFKEGDLKKAIEFYMKALDLFLEEGAKEDLISLYNNLGQVHLKMVEIEEAEEYLKLAIEYADELNHPARFPIRMNLANILYNQSKFTEALRIYTMLGEYFHDDEKYYYEAVSISNAALCQTTLKNHNESYALYLKSLEIFEKLDSYEGICHTCTMLCDNLLTLDRKEEAHKYLQKAEEIAKEHNLKHEIEDIYEKFSKYYQATNQHDKAIQYLKKVIEEKDKNYKEYSKEKISELEAKYKTEIYKLKNQELGNKNTAMQNQIRKLHTALKELKETHQGLKLEFQKTSEKINEKDNFISSQSRNSAVGEMVSAIAHQWKQPLNVIWLLSQAIGDAWEYDEITDDFLTKQISLIGSQIDYMNETINDFRNFFKQDYINDFLVYETIEKALKLLDYSLKKSNISVEVQLDKKCKLSGNPNELTQSLLNILNNARQALERSKPEKPLIRIQLSCISNQVQVVISNNGEHIEDAVIEKLFDAYFTTRKEEGTGLGLHICKEIIESKFKGSIEAQNTEYGVEFIINLSNQ